MNLEELKPGGPSPQPESMWKRHLARVRAMRAAGDERSAQNVLIADAADYLQECAKAYRHLALIFGAIERRMDESSDLRKLASTGNLVALDCESFAAAWRKEFIEHSVEFRNSATRSGTQAVAHSAYIVLRARNASMEADTLDRI